MEDTNAYESQICRFSCSPNMRRSIFGKNVICEYPCADSALFDEEGVPFPRGTMHLRRWRGGAKEVRPIDLASRI